MVASGLCPAVRHPGHLCLVGAGPRGTVCAGQAPGLLVMPSVLSSSQRVHGHQEEVQVPVLQLLSHAPVHPQAPHALPHRRAALPLRDLREEVHPAGAHEAAHAGELGWGRPGSGVRGHPGVCPVGRVGGMVWITTGSPEVGSTQPLISPTWLRPRGLRVEAGPHHTLRFLSASGTPALGPWVPPGIHFSAQRRVRAQPSPRLCAVRSPVSVGARHLGVRC